MGKQTQQGEKVSMAFIPLNFLTSGNKDVIPHPNSEEFLKPPLFPHTLIFNTYFHLRAMI